MADCPSCQSSMSDDAEFCGHCGSRMTAGAEPTWHRDNADVAPEEEREAADTVDEQKPTVPGKKNRKRLILLMVLSVLFINSLFIGLVVLRDYNAEQELEREYQTWLRKPSYAYVETTQWDAEEILAHLINPVGLVLGVGVGWGIHTGIRHLRGENREEHDDEYEEE